MKNLFKYATKELSQDAFLAWLFENWDDPEIGNVSKSLLAKLISSSEGEVNSQDISKVTVKTQYKHSDLYVEFFLKTAQRVLVIEDKTSSNPHSNQLKKYRENLKINNSNIKFNFVYYKTNIVEDKSDEYNAVFDAGWTLFDIKSIKPFFEKEKNNKNVIIRFYAEHVVEIYKKLYEVNTNKNVIDWDMVEGLSYFKKDIEEIFRKYHQGSKQSENSIYQGRYSSYRTYFTFTGKYKERVYPLVEFIFRENCDDVILYAHICWREGDLWTWKWHNKDIHLDNKETILTNIRSIFEKCGFKKRGSLKNEKMQTFATMHITKKDGIEFLSAEIEKVFKKFTEELVSFDKNN